MKNKKTNENQRPIAKGRHADMAQCECDVEYARETCVSDGAAMGQRTGGVGGDSGGDGGRGGDKGKDPPRDWLSFFARAKGVAGTPTFANDAALPPMPLPPLDATLRRWLDSVRPHVGSPDEWLEAQRAAREFKEGPGGRLDRLLQQRAREQRNWVERWWLEGAYLAMRQPLVPFYSMCGALPIDDLGWTLGDKKGIYHGAKYIHCAIALWVILRQERLLTATSADRKTNFSMSQFLYLFNTVRVPSEPIDKLHSYFQTESEGSCPSHVIVLSNGRIFRVEALGDDGTPISCSEWERLLTKIAAISSEKKGPSLGLLTCDSRPVWAKNRKHLLRISSRNKKIMHEIDTAILVIALDDDCPSTETETIYTTMSGNLRNRWVDKSLCSVFYRNGNVGGLCDHTAFDGAVSVSTLFFIFAALMNGGPTEAVDDSEYAACEPQELEFSLDSMITSELCRAEAELAAKTSILAVVHEAFIDYGRDLVQSHRLHPDSFAQMALQFAYMRMHSRPAPTYETATTRAYYNGRTETLRSCTMEVVEWVQAMLDDKRPAAEKKVLFLKAIQRHDQLMREAKQNAGCDRHLFGLYCLALEEGLPIPELYNHPAYIKSGGGGNFILSTSLLGYTPIGGGTSPMCLNGYGCFYNLMNEKLVFTITAFKASRQTSALKFYDNLKKSLQDMMAVLEQPTSKM